ncbi:MAG: GHKL domain-containing protein [Oscillospiraceae bacterium]|nr:GHKL domain-containing protein [Oscillospiraceae bacterium]
MKSVTKTVEKYGGLLKTNANGNWFEASVIMYEK